MDGENSLTSLQSDLEQQIKAWEMPPGVTREEIVTEAMSTYWLAWCSGRRIEKPVQWLLATARRKKLELFRRNNSFVRPTDAQLEALFCPMTRLHGTRIRLKESKSWADFSPKQRFVLRETIMHGRPVSEVAAEVNIKRSTAKSWVSRLPRRLAGDTYFQSLVKGRM